MRRKCHYEDTTVGGRIILKWKWKTVYGLNSFGSRDGLGVVPWEHGNKSVDSIHKCREFLECLKNCKLFEKESGPTNYLDKTRNIVTSVKLVLRKAWPNSCSLVSSSDTRL